MRQRKFDSYCELRRRFSSLDELGNVINRCQRTVFTKMKETGFTRREQFLILQYLGIEDTEENRTVIFRR